MYFILIILLAIILLFAAFYFKIYISPYNKLAQIKKKYGDLVEIVPDILFTNKLKEEKDDLSYYRNIQKKNPKIKAVAFNIGPKIGFFFVDLEHIKFVHQNHESFVKLGLNPGMAILFQKSLSYANGKSWQRQRSFLGKSFHFDQIRNYLSEVKDISKGVFNQIYEKLDDQQQTEVNLQQYVQKVTSEVIQRTFFGQMQDRLSMTKPDGSRITIVNELLSTLEDSYKLMKSSKYTQIKNMLFQEKCFTILPSKQEKELHKRMMTLKQACYDIIETRRQQLIKDSSQYKYNFLDIYLKETIVNKNKEITDQEIVDNFIVMFFAGTETSGNMAISALYYLSMHPEFQKQARDEILKILSAKNSSKDPKEQFDSLTFEDFSNMNFLTLVLKETLRLIPPGAAVLYRKAVDDIKVGDIYVEKGNAVNTMFLFNQINPDVFPNPEEFIPNRWIDSKLKDSFNFTPFSIGGRNCIGQHLAMVEGKCMLAFILLHFDVIRNHQQELILVAISSYGAKYGNLVHLKKRASNK